MLFLMYIYGLHNEVISSIAMYADNIGLLIYDNSLNWLTNLNLTYETLGTGIGRLAGFNAGKTQLIPFNSLKICDTLDVKMDGSVHWDCILF